MKKDRKKSEGGFIILEATFCIVISMVVMILLMSVSFWLYQQVMVSVVANEISSEVAQNYKLINVQDNADVTAADIAEVGKYRYSISKKSFDQENEKKATRHASGRLSQTSLAQADNRPSVKIETVIDDVGRRHYEVTVSQRYTFLFGNILEWIGLNGKQTIERTSYVPSTDILSYVNSVKTESYIAELCTGNTTVGKTADSIISAVNAVVELVRNWGK